ncbi:MAG: conjugal transfer protein TraF [Clostridia bacterium]|nr:conjugal transfer protein TraF [Clostridia bacterium]
MPIIEINESNFGELERADKAALVEFYAPWCASCRALSPTLERFAEHHPDLAVCKINTDTSPTLAGRFKIMSIPTLIYMRGGEVVSRSVGGVGLRALEELVGLGSPAK